MTEDFVIGTVCFAGLALVPVVFLIGSRFGFDDGMVKGKNEGIVFCMEQPQKCKISYDYLKLQENQK